MRPHTYRLATAAELTSADYWARHVREAVRFHDGVRTLEENGVRLFVEVGPDAVLTAMARDCLTAGPLVLAPTLRRDRPEPATLLLALAGAWTHGRTVDWRSLLPDTVAADPAAGRLRLPPYAFQHRPYWLDAVPESRPPGPDGGGADGWAFSDEGEFWSAVLHGDPASLARMFGARDEERRLLAELQSTLAGWRRQRGWTYAWEWRRLPETRTGLHAGSAAVEGGWLLVEPWQEDREDQEDDAQPSDLHRALTAAGARLSRVSVAPADDAAVVAERIGEALERIRQGGAVAGVLSALASVKGAHPEHPALPLASP
ncbi:hypothetical protein [Streptomyces sp. NPDC050263]|uniref:hypothetical protein n=1 Tax=Streptomyces sp. NPDC050263 TaxID=3155037 RepID=UPI0034206219